MGQGCQREILTKWQKAIEDLFYEKAGSFQTPSKEEVRIAMGYEECKESMSTFEEVFNIFLTKEKEIQQWSQNTWKNLRTVLTDFSEFRKDVPIESIDKDTIMSFVVYLHGKGMTNYSIDSLLRKFRRFMKWAYDNGFTKNDTGFTFKPKLHYAFDEPLYLRPDELSRLESCYLPKHLVATRDVFIFCCFSGLRYSDVSQLRKAQVHDDYFEIITEKTNDTLKIELNDHSKAVLQRYKNIEGPYALPVLSNAKTNLYLKDIGVMAGLNRVVAKTKYIGNERVIEEKTMAQLLTFHVARKTFITMALYLDIQPEVFMKWTGHKSFVTLKRYLGIVDELKEESMKKFNNI